MEEDARKRDPDFETYSRRVNNLSFQEQISVCMNQRVYGTPETPSQLRMSFAINNYPLNAKNKTIGMRALRESESPQLLMLNTGDLGNSRAGTSQSTEISQVS